jgi:hypothetical protein
MEYKRWSQAKLSMKNLSIKDSQGGFSVFFRISAMASSF